MNGALKSREVSNTRVILFWLYSGRPDIIDTWLHTKIWANLSITRNCLLPKQTMTLSRPKKIARWVDMMQDKDISRMSTFPVQSEPSWQHAHMHRLQRCTYANYGHTKETGHGQWRSFSIHQNGVSKPWVCLEHSVNIWRASTWEQRIGRGFDYHTILFQFTIHFIDQRDIIIPATTTPVFHGAEI